MATMATREDTQTEEAIRTTSSSEAVEVAEAKGEDATEAAHHNPQDVQDHIEDGEGTNNPSNYVDNHFNKIKAFGRVNLEYMTKTSNNPTDNVISNTEPEIDPTKDTNTEKEQSKRDITITNQYLKKCREKRSKLRILFKRKLSTLHPPAEVGRGKYNTSMDD